MADSIMDELILRSLRGEATKGEEKVLVEWRQQSPSNEARYQQVHHVWQRTAALEPSLRRGTIPTAAGLLAHEDDEAQPSTGYRRRISKRWLRGAVAAAAVLVLGVGISQFQSDSHSDENLISAEYATGPNDLLTVPLGDRSVVRLAPSSRLRVTRGEGSRDVWLEGRAYFSVAKQDGKRFRVRTAGGEAVVLGTRFDLQARDRELRLVVVEGRVALSDGGEQVTVAAGQVSAVVEGKVTQAVPVPNSRAMVDWIGNFLVFQETNLVEAAAELGSLYGVEVRVEDKALASRTVTGWFSDQKYEEVVTAVCRVVRARCTVGDSLVVMNQ